MTYTESYALMNDQDFRGRIQVAALKFADSIMIEGTNVPAHNTRTRWAQTCFTQPQMTAANLQSPVVMDAQVQTDGAEITDAALQVSVETVVGKML
jgi:hypothetical protein